jgi:hypothetical protein
MLSVGFGARLDTSPLNSHRRMDSEALPMLNMMLFSGNSRILPASLS